MDVSGKIIKSVHYAKSINSDIVSLTGFDGGELKDLSDINLHVATKKGDYGLVEDTHLIFNHILFSYLSRY